MAKTDKYFEASGTRKTSTARVRLFKGEGATVINGQPLEEYYTDKFLREKLSRPLIVAGLVDKVYYTAKVRGGGRLTGQLDAIVLALSRAIEKLNPDKGIDLRKEDLLSRDPRKKERKKYYLKKARKRPQFSKR